MVLDSVEGVDQDSRPAGGATQAANVIENAGTGLPATLATCCPCSFGFAPFGAVREVSGALDRAFYTDAALVPSWSPESSRAYGRPFDVSRPVSADQGLHIHSGASLGLAPGCSRMNLLVGKKCRPRCRDVVGRQWESASE